MTEGYLLDFIRERMREMGYKSFHHEPVLISVKQKDPFFIAAYNEFYYLVSLNLPDSLLIAGDTDVLYTKNFQLQTYTRLKEFTGNITIESPQDYNIEFIRVIPQL
jgi:hypothetical protein